MDICLAAANLSRFMGEETVYDVAREDARYLEIMRKIRPRANEMREDSIDM